MKHFFTVEHPRVCNAISSEYPTPVRSVIIGGDWGRAIHFLKISNYSQGDEFDAINID